MPAYDAQRYRCRSEIAATPAANLLPHHGGKTSTYYSKDHCGLKCQHQFATQEAISGAETQHPPQEKQQKLWHLLSISSIM